LKIALVILHADPARGGAETYTIGLAAALAKRGHDVSLLAADFAAEAKGVRRVQLESRAATRRGSYGRLLAALEEHLEKEPYDIVHAMLPVRRCDVYHPHAGLAAETMRKLHSWFNWRRRLYIAVEREMMASTPPPVVLCLSDYVKETIERHYPLPPERLATLFNAVDLERFKPGDGTADRRAMGIGSDRIVALIVAQFFERKGLRQAIEAISARGDPRLLLVVVGRDDPAPYRKLSEQVRFVGAVSDPLPFYRAADFFILPTRHDPCSLATLEALAMGLPVISTRLNGACEIMREGVHGFVLPDPNDVPAIAKAIGGMELPLMRQACLDLRPRLSFGAHVERLESIYESCRRRSQKLTARSSP
jgi:UDP-glucose:(heptosyl)LPS alpha-1,3-glucosyltransferase